MSLKKIIIAAITLDGKIAKNSDHNADWTSKEDKKIFRTETKKAGVVIFGSKTYETIGRPLPDRLNIIMTREPKKYIEKQKKNFLEFTSDSPPTILNNLMKRGYNNVVIGGGNGIYSLFLQMKLVDEICLTIAPKIFGQGISLFKDIDIDETDLKLISVKKINKQGEILVKYKLNNKILCNNT